MIKITTLHVPQDKELLAAFGEMALRHEHLNHVLRMTIKTIEGLTVSEALDSTAFKGYKKLRTRIRKSAKNKFGEAAPAFSQLQTLLERCERVTEKRNELMHSVWDEWNGKTQIRRADLTCRPLPTTQELSELSIEIQEIAESLNDARLKGFISNAILKSGTLR